MRAAVPASLSSVFDTLDALLVAARERARDDRSTAQPLPHAALFDAIAREPHLTRLAAACDLSPIEIATVLLALAPDVDIKYGSAFACLHNDASRVRPTPALAIGLFCENADERAAATRAFLEGADFFQRHVLEPCRPDRESRLQSELRLESQILGYLLGSPALDPAIATWCDIATPGEPDLEEIAVNGDLRALMTLAAAAQAAGTTLVAHLHGPHGAGKLRIAWQVAGAIAKPILTADLRGMLRSHEGFRAALERTCRDAFLRDALLFLHGYDALAEAADQQRLRELERVLSASDVTTVVAGTARWRPAGDPPLHVFEVRLDVADPIRGARAWSSALAAASASLPQDDVSWLAARFPLTPAQIVAAVQTATATRQWEIVSRRLDASTPIARMDLAHAARAQCGTALASMAHRVTPRRAWLDLVVPDDSVAVLHEIAERVIHRRQVFDRWGFGARLQSTGVTALFAGPSGTGKTLAAEVLASHLDLDLFRIDLARIVSKYIGETEKNLDRVFEAARDANGVLLFDEAEALFGKRTDVRDAHDRYANLEVAYLLQKMEEFDGLAILSTNLRQNMDEAFTRRLAFTVHFPFPDEDARQRIWTIVWPDGTPRAGDIVADDLAREFVLSGGGIKNTALAAAFYAAADGGVVTRAHVLHAARREFQKIGKVAVPQ